MRSYRTAVDLHPGLSARVTLVVGEDDTAVAFGSGDVPVLATPRLIALCEAAACQAVAPALSEEAHGGKREPSGQPPSQPSGQPATEPTGQPPSQPSGQPATGERAAGTRTTVGVRVQFDHLAPVKVGSEVAAEATLDRVEGRRLVFTVSASDEAGVVGCGRVVRVVVDREAFNAKAR